MFIKVHISDLNFFFLVKIIFVINLLEGCPFVLSIGLILFSLPTQVLAQTGGQARVSLETNHVYAEEIEESRWFL